MQTVGRKIRRGHGRGHRETKNDDPSSEMRPIMHTVRQKFSIGNAKMATVRQECIASQHRERDNEYRSSEMRPIMRTVREKINTGNSKMATVPQKFIASQHREHETRTVRR